MTAAGFTHALRRLHRTVRGPRFDDGMIAAFRAQRCGLAFRARVSAPAGRCAAHTAWLHGGEGPHGAARFLRFADCQSQSIACPPLRTRSPPGSRSTCPPVNQTKEGIKSTGGQGRRVPYVMQTINLRASLALRYVLDHNPGTDLWAHDHLAPPSVDHTSGNKNHQPTGR
jgi:hypothetical protein